MRKIMKRGFCLFLVAVLLAGLVPYAFADETKPTETAEVSEAATEPTEETAETIEPEEDEIADGQLLPDSISTYASTVSNVLLFDQASPNYTTVLKSQISVTYQPNGTDAAKTAYIKNLGWHFARYNNVPYEDDPIYCIEPCKNYAASTSGNYMDQDLGVSGSGSSRGSNVWYAMPSSYRQAIALTLLYSKQLWNSNYSVKTTAMANNPKEITMKTIKKIVCALMTLVLLLSSVPAVFADEAKTIDQDAACSLTVWKFDYTNAKKDGVWDEDAFPSTGWQESYVENALVNTNRKGDTDGQNGNVLGNGQTSKGYAIAGVEFTYLKVADITTFQNQETTHRCRSDHLTENTFDSYLYQLVEGKQKFIGQIMTSKSPVRSAEDIDETALSYAEIKALCSGNPQIKEKMDLDIEVQKLKLLRSNHMSQRYALEDKLIHSFPMQIASTRQMIDGLRSDMVLLKENTHPNEDGFSPMVIGGHTFTEKKAAGTALLGACNTMTGTNPIPLGSYRGFQMTLCFDSFEKLFKISMQGALTYKVGLGTDIFGNIQRIDNLLESMPTRQIEYKEKLKNLEIQVENAKQEVAKPFPREDELKEKSARLDQLNILLNMDKRENEIVDGVQDEDEIQPQRESRDLER